MCLGEFCCLLLCPGSEHLPRTTSREDLRIVLQHVHASDCCERIMAFGDIDRLLASAAAHGASYQ